MVVRLEHQFFGKRLAAATLFSLIALSLLILRLYYLQGIYGAYFRDQSENNRRRTIRTVPPRGSMFDRQNRLLVGNRPAFDVELIPEDVTDLPATLAKVSAITGRSTEELSAQLAAQHGRHHFEPKLLIADVPHDEMAKIKAHAYELPGVIVDVVPTRNYPFNELAAQVFGYAREVTKEQLEGQDESYYRRGDIVGQSGLEKTWEKALRGKSGYRQVEVDARGNRTGDLGMIYDDEPGQDLMLSIDLDLQQAAQEGMKGKKGAVVVLDPNNGEVLALVSSPSFDANIFSGNVDPADWAKVNSDRALPLTDRPISSTYPVGSTFKLITTTAVLAEKKMTPETQLNCPGYFMFAGRAWKCHKHSGHGVLNLRRALAVSCNAFYFQVGQMLGIELIEKYAKKLGLGAPTGIDLPGEVSGIVPSDEWKRKKYGVRWYPGDTLPVSIGQGYVVATPIQMTTMAATIANGGTVYRPQLVKEVIHRNGQIEEFGPTVIRETGVNEKVYDQVRDIASGVVNDEGATGKAAKFEEIRVGGKTGTAQVTGLGREHMAEGLMDHAWFLGFAPVEKPMIALGIIVENGGHGGTAAAPISHKIMEVFFKKKGMLKSDEPVVVPPVQPADTSEGVGEEAVDQAGSEPDPEHIASEHTAPEHTTTESEHPQ